MGLLGDAASGDEGQQEVIEYHTTKEFLTILQEKPKFGEDSFWNETYGGPITSGLRMGPFIIHNNLE
mgnify:CR=1 FL=1